MHNQLINFVACGFFLCTSLVSAAPFYFPLKDGFPNPSNASLLSIERQAGGSLSNVPPPPSISDDGLTNLKFIAFNELFEVAFFTELLQNVTSNTYGYRLSDDRKYIIDALRAIKNQEELHAINANKALAHFGASPILPCEYVFPVASFDEAIALADTFTDVVLGTLQEVVTIFADNKDDALPAGIASVIGQEGEQEGFYRFLQNKVPSSAPFLTASARDFAFTAIQRFTVKGSCPSFGSIPLATFGTLNLLSKPEAKDSQLTFEIPVSISLGNSSTGVYSTQYGYNTTSYSLVYITGQNLPIVETSFTFGTISPDSTTFSVPFPFVSGGFNHGLTIAALVRGSGPFENAQDVADSTLFGPAFIEVL